MIVLLVDDEQLSINALTKNIPWSSLGIQTIITAEDGYEGFESYREYKPDLIITDVTMPRLNGLQLVKKIRELDAQVPIIILSGYDEFDYAKEAVYLKVSHYLLKPIIHSEMISIIGQLIAETNTEKKHQQYLLDMQHQLHEAMPVLREQFILDLITGKLKMNPDTVKKMRFFTINTEMSTCCCAVLNLELFRLNNDKTFSENDWYLYKFAAANIVQEVITTYGKGYVSRYIEDRLPLMIYGDEPHELKQAAVALSKKIIDTIAYYLEIPSNIGVGGVKDSGALLHSYKESKQALLLSALDGYERVFHIDDADMIISYPHHTIGSDETEIMVQAVLGNKLEEVLARWLLIDNKIIHSEHVSLAYWIMAGFAFLNGIMLKIAEEIHSPSDVYPVVHLPAIYQVQTKEQLAFFMKESLLAIHQFVETHDSVQSGHKYIQTIKLYVKEHYQHELSVTEISKRLHLSREYISKLFKRETGESISSYITKFRIHEAKRLMESSYDWMMYEISAKVGYTDPNYFCRVFKSVVGIKPSEYMQSIKNKHGKKALRF